MQIEMLALVIETAAMVLGPIVQGTQRHLCVRRTSVEECTDVDSSKMVAKLEIVPIDQLASHIAKKAPVDVMAIVVNCGEEGTVKRKSDDSELRRLNITLVDQRYGEGAALLMRTPPPPPPPFLLPLLLQCNRDAQQTAIPIPIPPDTRPPLFKPVPAASRPWSAPSGTRSVTRWLPSVTSTTPLWPSTASEYPSFRVSRKRQPIEDSGGGRIAPSAQCFWDPPLVCVCMSVCVRVCVCVCLCVCVCMCVRKKECVQRISCVANLLWMQVFPCRQCRAAWCK